MQPLDNGYNMKNHSVAYNFSFVAQWDYLTSSFLYLEILLYYHYDNFYKNFFSEKLIFAFMYKPLYFKYCKFIISYYAD